MTASMWPAIALAAVVVLSGCTASTPERTSAIPELVRSDMTGEKSLFIYTDHEAAAETASRRGYNVAFPILDQRRQYQ